MAAIAALLLIPPLEKGRVVAAGDRVGISHLTPTRRAMRADLPLSGGGMEAD
ncbi:MAG: hypothetical protein QOD40_2747 [Alphaproteobacteria bacterium]|jgi:hypothetical protein|nr:hypothetical protein [Alphaproteobacteria bacterium]